MSIGNLPSIDHRVPIGSERFGQIERFTIVAIVLFYVVGDITTSVVGMEFFGTHESREVGMWFVETFGYGGFFIQKSLMLGVIASFWFAIDSLGRKLTVSPRIFRTVILGIFAYDGLRLTIWNSYLIFRVATTDGPVYILTPF